MSQKVKIIALTLAMCIFAVLFKAWLDARESAQKIGTKLEIATEAISGAVDEKRAVSKVSIQHNKKKAVALDSVGRILKEVENNAPNTEACPDSLADADDTRLFNDAVAEVNRLIHDSVRVP